jgi:hypothetical protein
MLRRKKTDWSEEQRVAEAAANIRVAFGKGGHSVLHGRVVGYVQQAISRDGTEFVVEPLLLVAVDKNNVMDIIRDVPEPDKPAFAEMLKAGFNRETSEKTWNTTIWTVSNTTPEELIFPYRIDDVALQGINAEFPA